MTHTCFHLWPPLSSSSTLLYMPSSPPFMCQCVSICTCLAVTKVHFEKKRFGHAQPMCACQSMRQSTGHCVCPMRMPLKGWSKMTQTSGSSRPHRWASSTGVIDSNERKPTVTAVSGGCARSLRRAQRAEIGVNRARKKRKIAKNRENRYGATPVRRSPRRIYATLRYAAYGPANPRYEGRGVKRRGTALGLVWGALGERMSM